ncbi:MAG: hypothetical protein LYZ66_02770 [Nitrososphaerales archaeon]|nr:hypothetical protein [Nitrososphaerales archaeon]
MEVELEAFDEAVDDLVTAYNLMLVGTRPWATGIMTDRAFSRLMRRLWKGFDREYSIDYGAWLFIRRFAIGRVRDGVMHTLSLASDFGRTDDDEIRAFGARITARLRPYYESLPSRVTWNVRGFLSAIFTVGSFTALVLNFTAAIKIPPVVVFALFALFIISAVPAYLAVYSTVVLDYWWYRKLVKKYHLRDKEAKVDTLLEPMLRRIATELEKER